MGNTTNYNVETRRIEIDCNNNVCDEDQSGVHREHKLYVRTLTGNLHTFDYDTIHFIDDLKYQLEKAEGIPISQQRIIYAGKELGDSRPNFWGPGATMHLVLRSGNYLSPSYACGSQLLGHGLVLQPPPEFKHDCGKTSLEYEERNTRIFECKKRWNPKKAIIIRIEMNKFSKRCRCLGGEGRFENPFFQTCQLQIFEIKKGKENEIKNARNRVCLHSDSLDFHNHDNHNKTTSSTLKFEIIPSSGSWKANTMYYCVFGKQISEEGIRWTFRTKKQENLDDYFFHERIKFLVGTPFVEPS